MTKKLLEALVIIRMMKNAEVTAIQFEDGSGYKFNYQLDGSQKWEFIDFSIYDLRKYWFNLDNEIARLRY